MISLHMFLGDIGQSSRQATLRQFREGGLSVLVATDVAARGLDIAGVSSNAVENVVNEIVLTLTMLHLCRLTWSCTLRHLLRPMTMCTGQVTSSSFFGQRKLRYSCANRSGRTGRAGRNGTSVLLYTASEERKLGRFAACYSYHPVD
jgi:hypothetical protein